MPTFLDDLRVKRDLGDAFYPPKNKYASCNSSVSDVHDAVITAQGYGIFSGNITVGRQSDQMISAQDKITCSLTVGDTYQWYTPARHTFTVTAEESSDSYEYMILNFPLFIWLIVMSGKNIVAIERRSYDPAQHINSGAISWSGQVIGQSETFTFQATLVYSGESDPNFIVNE